VSRHIGFASLPLHGGKGGVSRKTPQQIADVCAAIGLEPAPLVYAGRIWNLEFVVTLSRIPNSKFQILNYART